MTKAKDILKKQQKRNVLSHLKKSAVEAFTETMDEIGEDEFAQDFSSPIKLVAKKNPKTKKKK